MEKDITLEITEAELNQAIEHLADYRNDTFLHVAESEALFMRKNSKQTFALFGPWSYDIKPFEFTTSRGDHLIVVPVCINGKYFLISPDEGRCQLFSWMVNQKTGEKHLTLFSFGWIYTSELNLSNQQINENTEEMLDNGTLSIAERG